MRLKTDSGTFYAAWKEGRRGKKDIKFTTEGTDMP